MSCRIYSDGLTKDNKQSFISWLVAVTTLTIYTGWMHILLGLMLGSFFSRTCFYVLVAVWSTTFLPAKPVLWNAFCSSWVSQQQQSQQRRCMCGCPQQLVGTRIHVLVAVWSTSFLPAKPGFAGGAVGRFLPLMSESTAADSRIQEEIWHCRFGTVGLVAVWSTTFLPAKPQLWNAFCRSWGSQQQQLQHMQQESAGSVEAVTGKANSLERLPLNQSCGAPAASVGVQQQQLRQYTVTAEKEQAKTWQAKLHCAVLQHLGLLAAW
jgi:hypothetical protein